MRPQMLLACIAIIATPAFAQSSPPAAAPPAAGSPPQTAGSETVPVPPAGKRVACRQEATSKDLRGQDRRDAIFVCVAQGQLDCAKQAVDQKIVGPARRDFLKSCMGVREKARNK